MRPLEILFPIAGILPLAALIFSPAPGAPWLLWLALFPLLACAAQLLGEGYRWHSAIAYAAIPFLLIPLVWTSLWRFRILFAIAAAVIIAVSIFAALAFPVFSFAKPTGPHQIGTRIVHLIDPNREDVLAPVRGQPRELMVQVWYPADASKDLPRARYADKRTADWKMPQLEFVKTNAMENAPVEPHGAPYPLLVYSPCVTCLKHHNTFLCEDLASHGFVVVGIDHPYGAAITLFPDGRAVSALPGNFLDFTNERELRESTARVEKDIAVRTADARFVLDTAAAWNAEGPFTGRIDIHHAGIFGHSFGGGVAAEACRRDARFLAGVNMDGWMFGEAKPAGVAQPFFFMSDNTPRPTPRDLVSTVESKRLFALTVESGFQDIERSVARYGGYTLTIKGLEHMNFADHPLYTRLKRYSGGGSIRPESVHDIVRHYVTGFFRHYLKGHAEPLLDTVPSPYAEANFRKYKQVH